MERYTPEERGIIVTCYLTNFRSIVSTQREFRRRFPHRCVPCSRTIKRLAERLAQTGTTRDAARSGRPRIARSTENIAAVIADVRKNPETSTRRRCKQLGISRRSLQRILEGDLKMDQSLSLIGGCSLSTQMKEMVKANCSNDLNNFDAILRNNSLESLTKQTPTKETTSLDQEEKSKKIVKKQRKCSKKEGSISPPLQLPENMVGALSDSPVSELSASSGESKKNTDLSANCNNSELISDDETKQVTISTKRGSGRGSGKKRTAETI